LRISECRLKGGKARRARSVNLPTQFCNLKSHPAEGVEGAELDAPPVNVLIPPQLLQPGELILLLIKPSLWYIVLGSLRTLVTIVILTAIALQFENLVHRQDVLVAASGMVIVRLFWQFLDWFSRIYILTDRRVIRVMGVIRVEVLEASLKNIQHTQCLFSLRERLFGLGTISFATAGTGFPEAYWLMVARPLDVHQVVVKAMQRYR